MISKTKPIYSPPNLSLKNRFFKALATKFHVECSNPSKKEMLEMYIREKEEEYYNQNKSEFFELVTTQRQSEYYFGFLERQNQQRNFFFLWPNLIF